MLATKIRRGIGCEGASVRYAREVSGLDVSREEAKPTTYMSHLTPTIDVAMIIDSRKSV